MERETAVKLYLFIHSFFVLFYQDINECLENPLLCSLKEEQCSNDNGSYHCECATGYHDVSDGNQSISCIGKKVCKSTNIKNNNNLTFLLPVF